MNRDQAFAPFFAQAPSNLNPKSHHFADDFPVIFWSTDINIMFLLKWAIHKGRLQNVAIFLLSPFPHVRKIWPFTG